MFLPEQKDLTNWAKIEGLGEYQYLLQNDVGPQSVGDLLLRMDGKVVGDSQIPAELVNRMGFKENARELALTRLSNAAAHAMMSVGSTFEILGLTAGKFEIAVLGLAMEVGGYLASSQLENRAGNLVRDTAHAVIGEVNPRIMSALEEELEKKGLDRFLLDPTQLGNKLYALEDNATNVESTERLVKPLMMGLGLIMVGNEPATRIAGGVVAALGPVGVAIGEMVRQRENKYKVHAHRLAENVRVKPFTQFVAKNHEQMVNGLQMISQIPKALQAIALLFKDKIGAELPGVYIAIPQALTTFVGSLSSARGRVENARQTKAVTTMLEYLISPESLLLSFFNREPLSEREKVFVSANRTISNGIFLYNFLPEIGHFRRPFNMELEAGRFYMLRADSGTGKSVWTEAIGGKFRSEGIKAAIVDGNPIDLAPTTPFDAPSVVVISKDNIGDKGSKLVIDMATDVFRQAYMSDNPAFVSDEVLEKVKDLVSGLSEDEKMIIFMADYNKLLPNAGSPLLRKFSPKIEKIIKAYLSLKEEWVNNQINPYFNSGERNEKVNAFSSFDNISTGQKQRILNMLIKLSLLSGNTRLLVCDELTNGLDVENELTLLKDFNALIPNNDKSPAVVWIEHERNGVRSDAWNVFGNRCREIDLSNAIFEDEKVRLIAEKIINEDDMFGLYPHETELRYIQVAKLLNSLNMTLQVIFPNDRLRQKQVLTRVVDSYIDGNRDFLAYLDEVSNDLGIIVTPWEFFNVLRSTHNGQVFEESGPINVMYDSLEFYLRAVPFKLFSNQELALIYDIDPKDAQFSRDEFFESYWTKIIGYTTTLCGDRLLGRSVSEALVWAVTTMVPNQEQAQIYLQMIQQIANIPNIADGMYPRFWDEDPLMRSLIRNPATVQARVEQYILEKFYQLNPDYGGNNQLIALAPLMVIS